MRPYSIQTIANIIGARLRGAADVDVRWLLTDSRSLSFPAETLFFALRTQRGDGHRYIGQLYEKGVRAFVVSSLDGQVAASCPEGVFLEVDDALLALQQLAAYHRSQVTVPVVGVTGSNGKTMVKEWLYQLFAPQKTVTRSPRSYNSQIGVPLSLWLIDNKTDIAIIEAGISKCGEMQQLSRIINPTMAVLTNIGVAHKENFASREELCHEKLQLFLHAETAVYDADDEMIGRLLDAGGYQGRRICWSYRDKEAAFFIKKVDKSARETTIHYVYKGAKHRFKIPFIDEASIADSIVCAVVALQTGLVPDEIEQRMPQLEPIAMRLEVKEGRNGCTLINDSYNSDINSLDIALDFVNRRPDHRKRHRTLIISDILQSGMEPAMLYKHVSQVACERGFTKLIGIGEQISKYGEEVHIQEKYFFKTVKQFIESRQMASLENEVILLKGARRYGFDKITDLLTQRVHETTLEVNLTAMVENLNYYRSLLRPTTKIVCMVKADAYGAGAIEIAKTLQDSGIEYLAVAVADEGAELRRHGITANIMVMNPEMTAFKTIFDNKLEPEVYSFRLLDALIKAAEREGITGYPVHIKLDTGMHRLGFDPEKDMDKLVERLKQQNAVIPKSVFSHFAGADDDGFDDFSAKQFRLFDEGSKQLQRAFEHRILRHIDNSAGMEHFPERQLDMCRLGLGLYGVNPRNNAIINNVSTLKTTILQIRDVKKGDTVGYSRNGKIEKDSRIAAIPIGYADGLNRRLGNRNAYCIVKGHKADYVGNVCMDVAMIDVTGIDCEEGDHVEIFGTQLPVTELSKRLGTISYEVLTSVSNRVKRVYFKD